VDAEVNTDWILSGSHRLTDSCGKQHSCRYPVVDNAAVTDDADRAPVFVCRAGGRESCFSMDSTSAVTGTSDHKEHSTFRHR